MKLINKILFIVFLLTAFGFAQVKQAQISKQDSTELATIVNQFNEMQKQLQQDELRVMQDKSSLFDLRNSYDAKIKAISEGKKK